jgi:hypothetical protein
MHMQGGRLKPRLYKQSPPLRTKMFRPISKAYSHYSQSAQADFAPLAAILIAGKRPDELTLNCFRTGLTGFEPATSAVTGRCSNQLNYSPM